MDANLQKKAAAESALGYVEDDMVVGVGTGSTVNFFIDYEFKSRILGALMGTMFDRAFRMFTEAFEKRATAIYGS